MCVSLWQDWISRGWFDWESDGYPYWSLLHHARTWWEYRHLPNILCVHYADLLANLEGEVRRIAGFLDIELPDHAFAEIDRVLNAQGESTRGFDCVKERWFNGRGRIRLPAMERRPGERKASAHDLHRVLVVVHENCVPAQTDRRLADRSASREEVEDAVAGIAVNLDEPIDDA